MKNDLNDLIDDYLSGSLNPEQLRAFEQRLAEDPDFSAQVRLEKELQETLGRLSPENELRANLGRLSDKFDTPEKLQIQADEPAKSNKWWRILAVLALLAGIFVVWSLFFVMEEEVIPAPEVEQPTELPQETPRIEEPSTPAAEIPEASENTKAPAPRPQPMAAAFKPISKLETYIGSQVRSAGFHVRITAPKSGTVLPSRAGKTTLRISGKTEGNVPAGANFKLLIFNNNQQRFETMRPVESQAFPLTNSSDFVWEKQLPLNPGLYYFLIEEDQSGEWMFVDKFLVK